MPISADLGPTLEDYVTELVSSGRYGSKSEVIREGIRLVQEREARLRALDLSISKGLADVKNGATRDASDVFNRLEAKYGS
jgi:antitoxin ParD1/3/4